jgi:hypothetical protein
MRQLIAHRVGLPKLQLRVSIFEIAIQLQNAKRGLAKNLDAFPHCEMRGFVVDELFEGPLADEIRNAFAPLNYMSTVFLELLINVRRHSGDSSPAMRLATG